MSRLRFALFALVLVAAAPGTASAHFLWLVAGKHSPDGKVHIYFGESATPDDPDLLDRLGSPTVWHKADGKKHDLKASKGTDSLVAEPGDAKSNVWGLSHDYGVISRGGATYALKYHAKCLTSTKPADWTQAKSGDAPLELVPRFEDGKITVTALWQGKPAADGEYTVSYDGSDDIKGTANKNGEFTFVLPAGKLASIRIRQIEKANGEINGKKFEEARHYATLTVALEPGTETAKVETASTKPEEKPASLTAVSEKNAYAPLDPPATSFGGAILDNHVYVYGGHLGGAHNYAEAEQSDYFLRLDLAHPEKWENLGKVPKRTGFPLVAHQGKIYRVGGFVVKDQKDGEGSLTSTADFARFDPKTNKWEDLTPMPVGRSSHDAVVMGDQLFVFGGWELKGGEDRAWHDYGLVTDLSSDKIEWKKIPTPHLRRAVSVGEWQGKIVMIGGMQEKGGPTTATAIFDTNAGKWTDGPKLAGENMDGFGSSAFLVGKQLYVSTYSGKLQRLSDDGSKWDVVGKLEHPRFFHRMIPTKEGKLLVVGGASMETGKISALELLTVSASK